MPPSVGNYELSMCDLDSWQSGPFAATDTWGAVTGTHLLVTS